MKTLHELAIEYAKSIYQEEYDDPTFAPDVFQTKNDFAAGYKAAQEWISVDDELPKVEKTPYQVLGKNIMNGQFETYFIEYSNKNIKEECTHWRPINND